MEVKKVIEPCVNCQKEMEIDFATAQFAVQVVRIHGKTRESRTFYASCPNCQAMHIVESKTKEDWGNRKASSAKKVFYSVGFGCLGIVLLAALLFYFAGRGMMTVFDWLF